MLARYLWAELLKLRRSLALLLCIMAPSAVVILASLMVLDARRPMPWRVFGAQTGLFWTFAMLPLAVTALSVLLAQIEHGPRMWNHLLTLPAARPNLFLAKALTMLGLMGGMAALLFVELHAAGLLVHWLTPQHLNTVWDSARLAHVLLWGTAAATLMAMLQLWVALYFRGFVPPLVFGIAGTFVAVTATRSNYGAWFPWLLSMHAAATEADHAQHALALGLGGGLLALVLLVAHLSFREA